METQYVLLKVEWNSRDIAILLVGTKDEVLNKRKELLERNSKRAYGITYELIYRKVK